MDQDVERAGAIVEGKRTWRRAALMLGLLGVAAYAVALIATLPARWVAGVAGVSASVARVSGTVWSGAADLAGGHRADWDVNVLGSLVRLGVSADWRLRGQGTDIGGTVRGWAGGYVQLSEVSGMLAWPLVRAVAPRMIAQCDLVAVVDVTDIEVGPGPAHLEGDLRTGAAACSDEAGGVQRVIEVPPLSATVSDVAGAPTLHLAESADPTRVWAELGLLPDRRLAVTAFAPALAAVSPNTPGPLMLEFGF